MSTKKIYVELHNCILNADGSVNEDMVEFVNTLYNTYDIVVWTNDAEDALPDNLKYDYIAKKYFTDTDRFFIISNDKRICKEFAKKGINSLRFRVR